ncbi:hypothetical protein [Actinokineospora pegani]|uniref:hypothetical protein n=1 Tax=Actinokineospora pegani TaxID=2654637 RepID=UPI0012EAABB9|nr:hypothetical protein [Actinokineospora pegani]
MSVWSPVDTAEKDLVLRLLDLAHHDGVVLTHTDTVFMRDEHRRCWRRATPDETDAVVVLHGGHELWADDSYFPVSDEGSAEYHQATPVYPTVSGRYLAEHLRGCTPANQTDQTTLW